MMADRLQPPAPMLSDLLSGIQSLPTSYDRPIEALTLDSREVGRGTLFLACAGTRQHGLDHLRQAVEQGAAAVLCETGGDWSSARIAEAAIDLPVPLLPVERLRDRVSEIAGRFYGEPGRRLTLIGVTGTNGKSSCVQFIAQAFAPQRRCAMIGTLGNGFPERLEPATHTTPDPVRLQALLARLADDGADAVAMEVSSHALDQRRAEALPFATAVLTNLSRDHLDYHGDLDAYAAAKRRLFEMPGLGGAVINLDDPFGYRLAHRLPAGVEQVGYWLGERADQPLPERWICATGLRSAADGMTLTIDSSWGGGELRTPLLGRFNASNLLAVVAVLLRHGVTLADALARVARLRTPPGRMERFGGGGGPLVVVDYAHTPDALEQVLGALRPHAAGRLICLFGCGGERDRGKRPQMGAIAERLADRVVLSDDNPRNEDGDRIIAGILAGMRDPGGARVIRNRAAAIRDTIAGMGPGDLLLVAGKGHETSQRIGDLTLPFSDREQVAAALAEAAR